MNDNKKFELLLEELEFLLDEIASGDEDFEDFEWTDEEAIKVGFTQEWLDENREEIEYGGDEWYKVAKRIAIEDVINSVYFM